VNYLAQAAEFLGNGTAEHIVQLGEMLPATVAALRGAASGLPTAAFRLGCLKFRESSAFALSTSKTGEHEAGMARRLEIPGISASSWVPAVSLDPIANKSGATSQIGTGRCCIGTCGG